MHMDSRSKFLRMGVLKSSTDARVELSRKFDAVHVKGRHIHQSCSWQL